MLPTRDRSPATGAGRSARQSTHKLPLRRYRGTGGIGAWHSGTLEAVLRIVEECSLVETRGHVGSQLQERNEKNRCAAFPDVGPHCFPFRHCPAPEALQRTGGFAEIGSMTKQALLSEILRLPLQERIEP